ncbi:MAG: DUF47 family protein [Candidatus Omnitrophota bacterium]
MLKSRNVFEWIGRRRELNALQQVLKHLDKVVEAVLETQKAIEAFIRRDSAGVKEAIKCIAADEHEADVLRRGLMNQLTEGTFMPADREDMMHLINSQDNVADFAHTVGRTLALFDDFLPDEISKNLTGFIAIDVKAVNKLKEAVGYLIDKECDKALTACDEIEDMEEQGDDAKRELLRIVLRAKLDAAMLLLSRDLIEAIEEIADRIEDSGDEIRILAVELK